MKKSIFFLFILVSGLTSCSNDDEPVPGPTKHTVFMYLPWASDLLSYFYQNIADFEAAISQNILGNEKVIVFLGTKALEAEMYELSYSKGKAVRTTLKTYSFDSPVYTTAGGITSILKDVAAFAPAPKYAMTIGCHGMGWIPATTIRAMAGKIEDYGADEMDRFTRWFGGESPYQTDITTLREGLEGAGMKMEYILFDDCFMSSIEVAYELRNVAGHIIACPTEVMKYGMPYQTMAPHLVGTVNYEKATDAFLEFYKGFSTPQGTIGVTVCSELDALASIMKEINDAHILDNSLLGSIQRMDGYTPIRFFDLGDYVSKLCTDNSLLVRFQIQLEKTVPSRYRKHTDYFPTYIYPYSHKINAYSGVTTSDPSTSSATYAKGETSWWAATH